MKRFASYKVPICMAIVGVCVLPVGAQEASPSLNASLVRHTTDQQSNVPAQVRQAESDVERAARRFRVGVSGGVGSIQNSSFLARTAQSGRYSDDASTSVPASSSELEKSPRHWESMLMLVHAPRNRRHREMVPLRRRDRTLRSAMWVSIRPTKTTTAKIGIASTSATPTSKEE